MVPDRASSKDLCGSPWKSSTICRLAHTKWSTPYILPPHQIVIVFQPGQQWIYHDTFQTYGIQAAPSSTSPFVRPHLLGAGNLHISEDYTRAAFLQVLARCQSHKGSQFAHHVSFGVRGRDTNTEMVFYVLPIGHALGPNAN